MHLRRAFACWALGAARPGVSDGGVWGCGRAFSRSAAALPFVYIFSLYFSRGGTGPAPAGASFSFFFFFVFFLFVLPAGRFFKASAPVSSPGCAFLRFLFFFFFRRWRPRGAFVFFCFIFLSFAFLFPGPAPALFLDFFCAFFFFVFCSGRVLFFIGVFLFCFNLFFFFLFICFTGVALFFFFIFFAFSFVSCFLSFFYGALSPLMFGSASRRRLGRPRSFCRRTDSRGGVPYRPAGGSCFGAAGVGSTRLSCCSTCALSRRTRPSSTAFCLLFALHSLLVILLKRWIAL
jgi:hypothetical protein